MTAALDATASPSWRAATLEVAGARVLVACELVDKVIETPGTLGPALLNEPSMLGSFIHAGSTFPLCDLGRCLGLSTSNERPPPTTVLLRLAGKRAAVAVDRVESVKVLPSESLVKLSARGNSFALAPLPGQEEPAVVLQEDSLLALTGMMFADVPITTEASQPGIARHATHDPSFMSFSWAGIRYAFEITQVSEIVSQPTLAAASTLRLPGFLGEVETTRGMVLLLERPSPGSGEPPGYKAPDHAVVLETGDLRFAVPADEIHAMFKLGSAGILPLPRPTNPIDRSMRGLAAPTLGGNSMVVLDALGVLEASGGCPAVTMQSRQEQEKRRGVQAGNGLLRSFVELEAAGRFFTRLVDVQELAEVPRSSILLPHAQDGLDGYLQHRGEALAIVDLAKRLGHPARRADVAKLAIVQTEHGTIGFIVDGFVSVQHVHATALPQAGEQEGRTPRQTGRPYERHWTLTHVKSREQTRVVPVLDLAAVAREVQYGVNGA